MSKEIFLIFELTVQQMRVMSIFTLKQRKDI